MHLAQAWEEVRVVAAEVREQGRVLAQAQIRSDHFHREHLAIVQGWLATRAG